MHRITSTGLALSLLFAAAASGCSQTVDDVAIQSSDGGDDAGAPEDLLPAVDLLPYPHPKLPQMNPHSGVVFDHMNLVTVSFMDTVYTQTAESFGDFIMGSKWLAAVGAEYGVHAGKHLKKVELPMNAPNKITDSQLAKLCRDRIMDGSFPSPVDNPQILYMIYFPPNIIITNGTQTLCPEAGVGFGGYHGNSLYNNHRFAYAAIGDCYNAGPDAVTVTASHELIETATDPFGNSYVLDDPDDSPWQVMNGMEDGDLCESEPDVVHEGGFALQKSYSNMAAAASMDPCVPETPPVYQNVQVFVDGMANPVPAIPAGMPSHFTIVGWAVGQAMPWRIRLDDAGRSDFSLTQERAVLSSTEIWANGQVTLTVTPPADAPTGALGGLLIRSDPNAHAWPVAFTIQ